MTQSSPKLRESVPLLTGRGQFLDDINLPNTLHVAFVRSPFAHAKIIEIDTADALDVSGVEAILTGLELQAALKPLNAPMQTPTYRPTEWYPLAVDKVIYGGEPVAVVIANNRYTAEDAAELVYVDYEMLKPVASADQALDEATAPIHEHMDSNVLVENPAGGGVDDAVFAAAEHHVSGSFQHPRVHTLPIEGRGVLADFRDGTDTLTVWSSTQIPHILQDLVADSLSHPAQQIRVIAPNVGGGFGLKSACYPEEVLIPYLAKRLGRPVKWTQDRLEALQAGSHARDIVVHAELAADVDGKIIGLKAHAVCDVGAYHLYPYTGGLDLFSIGGSLPGPYDFEHYAFTSQAVCTNKCVVGAYRGVGAVMGPLVMEGLLNRLAKKLGKDPLEIRQINLARPDKFPFTGPSGATYDSGNYPVLLDLAMEESDYPELRQLQKDAQNEGRLVGIGLTCFVEGSAGGRSQFANRRMDAVPGFDAAIIKVNRQGEVSVFVSTPSQGQGQYTTFAHLLAESLGIHPNKINVILGDTATCLLYTSPSPRDLSTSRMPSSA